MYKADACSAIILHKTRLKGCRHRPVTAESAEWCLLQAVSPPPTPCWPLKFIVVWLQNEVKSLGCLATLFLGEQPFLLLEYSRFFLPIFQLQPFPFVSYIVGCLPRKSKKKKCLADFPGPCWWLCNWISAHHLCPLCWNNSWRHNCDNKKIGCRLQQLVVFDMSHSFCDEVKDFLPPARPPRS